jgi:hypothetical protein
MAQVFRLHCSARRAAAGTFSTCWETGTPRFLIVNLDQRVPRFGRGECLAGPAQNDAPSKDP